MARIEATNLTKRYGSKLAVDSRMAAIKLWQNQQ